MPLKLVLSLLLAGAACAVPVEEESGAPAMYAVSTHDVAPYGGTAIAFSGCDDPHAIVVSASCTSSTSAVFITEASDRRVWTCHATNPTAEPAMVTSYVRCAVPTLAGHNATK